MEAILLVQAVHLLLVDQNMDHSIHINHEAEAHHSIQIQIDRVVVRIIRINHLIQINHIIQSDLVHNNRTTVFRTSLAVVAAAAHINLEAEVVALLKNQVVVVEVQHQNQHGVFRPIRKIQKSTLIDSDSEPEETPADQNDDMDATELFVSIDFSLSVN